MTTPHTDCPLCPKGHPCGTPIRECHRQDAAGFYVERDGANLWCPCCGAFWRASDDDLAHAERAQAAWEKYQEQHE